MWLEVGCSDEPFLGTPTLARSFFEAWAVWMADGLQRPPGYRASHGHARYKSDPLPVDTVSSVEIAHQLHRGVEIKTFKLATFVQSRGARGEISLAVQHTHAHVTSAPPPPSPTGISTSSSSFRFRRRSRIKSNTPPLLEHFCIRLGGQWLVSDLEPPPRLVPPPGRHD